jgi:hypothetical protein
VGHVHVSYRGHMTIRIELRATNLAPSRLWHSQRLS